MSLEKQYVTYFDKFFSEVKRAYWKLFANKTEDEHSSGELAFKDAISSLPCPVSIIRLKVDIKRYKDAQNDVYHLIKYDFNNFGKASTRYFGEIDLDKIEQFIKVTNKFNLDRKTIHRIQSLKLIGYGDPDCWDWTWIISYDILQNPNEYIDDFIHSFWMTFRDKIIQTFSKEPNFNSKYGLKNDPILPLNAILIKDKIFDSFVKVDKYGKYIEDLQKNICDIQLIQRVPEKVKKVFNVAKKLYVFGYFEYYFFTISHHYAFLALESALRNKYNDIYDESRKNIGLNTIIKKLVDKGIIPKGEMKIYDAGRYLRNSLSHLTNPSIMTPSAGILNKVAFQINMIYD